MHFDTYTLNNGRTTWAKGPNYEYCPKLTKTIHITKNNNDSSKTRLRVWFKTFSCSL